MNILLNKGYKNLFMIFVLFAPLFANAQAKTSNEYQAVINAAYKYFEGAANGDQALLMASFDTEFGDVKMIRKDKEQNSEVIRNVPMKEFAGFFTKPTTETWQAEILSVDIVDNQMAMVKMDFKTAKTHYIDYLVMYKRNDQWRIINKTFVAKPLTEKS